MSSKSGWRCCLAQWGILWVRLALGVIFATHGAQKVFGLWGGQDLATTVAGFEGMGISAPLAYAAIFTELVGGIGITLGLLTRLSALGLAVVMGVAIVRVHWAGGFFLSNQGFEYCLALLGMSLGLLFTGAGCFSLDSLLFCRGCKDEESESCCAEEHGKETH